MGEMYEKGQVVIPKYMRDILKLAKGSNMGFRMENNQIIINTTKTYLEELERLTSQATSTDAETFRLIEKYRKKRKKEWLNVPGR